MITTPPSILPRTTPQTTRLPARLNLRTSPRKSAQRYKTGQYSEAVLTGLRALQLASLQRNSTLTQAISGQLALYQASTPFRDTASTTTLKTTNLP